MAIRYRSRAGRRFTRRKRQGAWTGFLVNGYTIAANATTSWYLWDDLASQKYSLAGKGVHQRTLWWVSFIGDTGGTQPIFGWYIAKYSTDANGIVPTGMIINALGWNGTAYNAEPLFERDVMQWNLGRQITSSVLPTQYHGDLVTHGDCVAKRKLDDTDAVLFTFSSTHAGKLTFATRTYVTW